MHVAQPRLGRMLGRPAAKAELRPAPIRRERMGRVGGPGQREPFPGRHPPEPRTTQSRMRNKLFRRVKGSPATVTTEDFRDLVG